MALGLCPGEKNEKLTSSLPQHSSVYHHSPSLHGLRCGTLPKCDQNTLHSPQNKNPDLHPELPPRPSDTQGRDLGETRQLGALCPSAVVNSLGIAPIAGQLWIQGAGTGSSGAIRGYGGFKGVLRVYGWVLRGTRGQLRVREAIRGPGRAAEDPKRTQAGN